MKKGIIGAVSFLAGIAAGAAGTAKTMGEKINENRRMSDKHLALFLMMNQWVRVKQEGKTLVSYFEQEGFHEIGVYGMHYAGETLADELRGSGVKIKYGIDKNAERCFAEFDIVTPDNELEEVDAIVVTPIQFFSEIKKELETKVNCPIISLKDVLDSV